jgi:hypothetical protein
VIVDGITYTSNAALQAAWRKRVSLYCVGKSRKVPTRCKVEPVDVAWFLQVCKQCPSHKTKLFNESTDMVIDRADAAFSPSKKTNIPGVTKHMKYYPCVFVIDKNTGRLRSLPNKVNMREASKNADLNKITNWMRNSIESQIDEFRSSAKATGQMQCHICQKSVDKKANHVDHGRDEHSFSYIATAFIKLHSMPTADKLNSKSGVIFRLKWTKFHRKHAVLSMCCPLCNLKNK